MSEYIKTSLIDGVGRIVLCRPEKRNALQREFIEELVGAVAEMGRDAGLRVLVLAAEGKAFCAGMDLGQMIARAESPTGPEELQKDSEVYCQLLTALFELPVPTIALLQGPALAGGVGLVLACDIVLASDQVFFMLPEPMRGITAAMVTPLLIHRVGSGTASYLLLSGERITAGKAGQLGLCHDVVTADQLESRCKSLVASILTGAPAALAITKNHIRHCSAEISRLVEESIEVSARARETSDAQEGLAAFLEKRPPRWQPGQGD